MGSANVQMQMVLAKKPLCTLCRCTSYHLVHQLHLEQEDLVQLLPLHQLHFELFELPFMKSSLNPPFLSNLDFTPSFWMQSSCYFATDKTKFFGEIKINYSLKRVQFSDLFGIIVEGFQEEVL